jgi:hypothetical protein
VIPWSNPVFIVALLILLGVVLLLFGVDFG